MTRRLAAGLGAAAVGLLAGFVVLTSEPGRIVEAQTFDWRVTSRTTPARDDIAIVDINESSVRALAPVIGRWPWPRAIMTTEARVPKDPIGFLDYYFVKKAPFQIPDAGREAIVKFGPWIVVVLLVLSLPALLVILGVGTFVAPFGGVGYAAGFGLAAIGLCVQLVLEVMALPGLFARKMSGWTLMFYARVVGIVTSLLLGAIVGAIISALIGFYILFQVRGLYK